MGLGGYTGAVSYQQSHCAGAGHSDGHAGGADGAGARRVGAGVALVGVGAHVTLELRGRLALHPAQLAEQHAAGPRPAEAAPRPAALLPLLPVVLLSVDAQVRERGEAWKTDTNTSSRSENCRQCLLSFCNICDVFPMMSSSFGKESEVAVTHCGCRGGRRGAATGCGPSCDR